MPANPDAPTDPRSVASTATLPIRLAGAELFAYRHTCAFFSCPNNEHDGRGCDERAFRLIAPARRHAQLRRLESLGSDNDAMQCTATETSLAVAATSIPTRGR